MLGNPARKNRKLNGNRTGPTVDAKCKTNRPRDKHVPLGSYLHHPDYDVYLKMGVLLPLFPLISEWIFLDRLRREILSNLLDREVGLHYGIAVDYVLTEGIAYSKHYGKC